jgi:hypothetical protein
MRNIRKYVVAAAGCTILIAGIALLTPRRSEAQFASPVRVMNTAAQAVPVTTGGTPYTHRFLQGVPQGNNSVIEFFTPSNSQGFTAEMFNSMVVTTSASNVPSVLSQMSCTSNGVANAKLDFGAQQLPGVFAQEDAFIVNTPVKFHCDANSQVEVFLSWPVSSDGNFTASYTIAGYLQ